PAFRLWVIAYPTICRKEGSQSPTFQKTSPCQGEGEPGLGGAPWPLRQRALQAQHWPAPSAGRLTRWKARERAWVWPAPLGAVGARAAGGGHRAGAHAPAGWGGRGRPRRGPAARRGETPRG